MHQSLTVLVAALRGAKGVHSRLYSVFSVNLKLCQCFVDHIGVTLGSSVILWKLFSFSEGVVFLQISPHLLSGAVLEGVVSTTGLGDIIFLPPYEIVCGSSLAEKEPAIKGQGGLLLVSLRLFACVWGSLKTTRLRHVSNLLIPKIMLLSSSASQSLVN